MRVVFPWVSLVLLGLGSSSGGAATPDGGYRPSGDCGGFARVDLQTRAGQCVGLMASGLRFPRGIAVLGHAVYVAEMGGWARGRGRLLAFGQDGRDAPRALLTGLDRPNGLVVGADGQLYLGVATGVLRVGLRSDGTATATRVLGGLPGTGRHPLVALAADPAGGLYLNVGSATNNCEPAAGRLPDPAAHCPELSGAVPRASILWFRPGVAGGDVKIVARGLRNAMALAVLPSGVLVAAVNARDGIDDVDPDLSDEDLPHDTYVAVRPGADYGWPYCYDMGVSAPEYRGHDCARFARPDLLLAPHAAPLGMVVYRGALLPGPGIHLIMAWHGYRRAGHVVVGLDVGPDGRPLGPVRPLIWGWHDVTERAGPHGAPTALAVMQEGSLLVTEDHNGTILRLTTTP